MNIDISEEAGVRYLHFGSSWVQGAMRIARPYALELEYTRELMTPLLLHEADWPRRVLQIGLGAASVTKFLWRYRPHARITVVEVDRASVLTGCRNWTMTFKKVDDKTLQGTFTDGRLVQLRRPTRTRARPTGSPDTR